LQLLHRAGILVLAASANGTATTQQTTTVASAAFALA
jgi:hypothetical protein